jgi:hypothetical protein
MDVEAKVAELEDRTGTVLLPPSSFQTVFSDERQRAEDEGRDDHQHVRTELREQRERDDISAKCRTASPT